MIVYERSRKGFETGQEVSGALFWYVHGGLLEASDKLQEWDPHLKRPVREVLDESLAKGWQHVWPKPGNDPRVMFCLVSNPLRRIRSYPLVLEHLWPKLRTIVTIDWRMTSTALHSDYVLPAAGLVRAHRAQVGDAAHALHPRRREGGRASTRRRPTGRSSRCSPARSTSAPRRAASRTSRIARDAIGRSSGSGRPSRRTASSVPPTTTRSRRR